MIIEFHMIKNYAPSNLNRDDMGMAKSCYFGDAMRARISSQCLKHSWRNSTILFSEVGENMKGIRTRKLPELVSEELRDRGISDEYLEIVKEKVASFGSGKSKDAKSSANSQIMFFSSDDILAVTDCIEEKIKELNSLENFRKIDSKILQDSLRGQRQISLDIALFGRMVTSNAFENIEASMQVAHAFSTNRVTTETDFFVAMDDLVTGKDVDDMGAGMIGDVDYNSSCYYIYASLNVDKLLDNLKNINNVDKVVDKIIPSLLKVMAFSNPSGKQNTFAANELPQAILIECKENNIPVSYANAFVEPASKKDKHDLVESSIIKLLKEVKSMDNDYGLEIKKRLWFNRSRYEISDEFDAVKCENFSKLENELRNIRG